ncbi:MAG: hypothetical protein RIF32_18030, partial [Leptospirales bacterium]
HADDARENMNQIAGRPEFIEGRVFGVYPSKNSAGEYSNAPAGGESSLESGRQQALHGLPGSGGFA